MRRWSWFLLVFLPVLLSGCLHIIHVTPDPDQISSDPIQLSLKVQVTEFYREGPGRRQEIYYLDWPREDFEQGVIDYIRKRRSFAEEGAGQAELTLALIAWLIMESRDRYGFTLILEATLMPPKGPPIKSYVVRATAVGPRVRWTTASDARPINEVVRLTLNDLLAQIEQDRQLIIRKATGS